MVGTRVGRKCLLPGADLRGLGVHSVGVQCAGESRGGQRLLGAARQTPVPAQGQGEDRNSHSVCFGGGGGSMG